MLVFLVTGGKSEQSLPPSTDIRKDLKFNLRKAWVKATKLLSSFMSSENEEIIPGVKHLKPGGELVVRLYQRDRFDLMYTEPETSPTPVRVILNDQGKVRQIYKCKRDEYDGSK